MKNKDIERQKEELRKVIYEEEYPIITKKVYEQKKKKPIFTNILLSLMLVCGLFFCGFLIIDSSSRINELYEIINAVLFFLVILGIVISFPKTFFKKKTGATIYLSFIIIITVIFNFLYLFGIIKLPTQSHIMDYTNKNILEATEWLDKNKISYDEVFEYSDTITKYNIINQSVKANTLSKNIKNVNLTVSKGPDYDKEVIIPDQSGMKTDDILDFVDKNYLKNVHIVFEENTEVSNDIIIKQTSTGKIKRSDSYIYTASLGVKEALSSIKLKNLKGEKLLNAEVYLGKNGILYELKYEFSSSTKRGCVISTDVKEGTTLKADDKVVLTISKGKEIKIPEFKGMSLKDVNKWIVENNLDMEYSDIYNDEVKKGKAISSNYKTGDIIEEETLISIIFSKGKLVLPKFNDLASFKAWASTYKINYEIKEEFNKDVPKDEIINFSIKEGEKIDLSTPIIVYISKGEPVTVSNFSDKTKDEAQKECDNLGIICLFYNTLSDKTEGIVLSQSITAGTEVAKGSNIDIEISTKKQSQVTAKKSSSTSNTSKNSTSSNNQTSSSTSNNTNTNTNTNNQNNTPSCETVTIRLNGNEVAPNDPNKTCSNLKSKFGSAINCSYITSDEGTNGFIVNASEIRNKEASSCNPVTAKIVKND